MTKESILKKILGVFIILSVFSFLWAIGANSRKKVELVKSGDLHEKLQQLTKANTVITSDLKKTKNAIGKIKKSMKLLKKNAGEEKKKSSAFDKQLTKERKKNNSLEKKIVKLKKINSSLGDELTKAKSSSINHKKQLKNLQVELNLYKKQASLTPQTQQAKPSKQKAQDSNNKSNWK